MGDIAYVFFGIVIIALLAMGIVYLIRMLKKAREHEIPAQFPLLAMIPGGIIGYGLLQILLRLITFFAQEDAIEAGHAQILGSVPLGLLYILIGAAVSYGVNRWQHRVAAKSEYSILPSFTTNGLVVVAAIAGALLLANFTYTEMVGTGAAKVAWIRIGAVSTGFGGVSHWLFPLGIGQCVNTRLKSCWQERPQPPHSSVVAST